MELADTLGKDDPYVGYYEVKGAYKVCSVCKKKYLFLETGNGFFDITKSE